MPPDNYEITRSLEAAGDRAALWLPTTTHRAGDETMRWGTVLTLGIAVVFTAGCAASRSSTPAVDPDVITEDQVVRSRATSAYDVIATLRPRMFTAHGAPTTRGQQPPTAGRQAMPVVVYIDNVKVGPVSELRALWSSRAVTARR